MSDEEDALPPPPPLEVAVCPWWLWEDRGDLDGFLLDPILITPLGPDLGGDRSWVSEASETPSRQDTREPKALPAALGAASLPRPHLALDPPGPRPAPADRGGASPADAEAVLSR